MLTMILVTGWARRLGWVGENSKKEMSPGMVQWKIAWQEMRRHPGRAPLTLLNLAIGVAAVLAMGLSTGLARCAYHEMLQTITGRAALEITAVNTLGMNVLEQTRELGLLRMVAMTRVQVRKMIVAQAAMLGRLGVVPGLLAGMAMAYVMNLSTLPVTGHPVAFKLHPLMLMGGFLAAMTIVLAAAWIPAERAARRELVNALHYE